VSAKKKKDSLERTATEIVDAAIRIHRTLGPGLLESAYQQCLTYELGKRGIEVECEVQLPVRYESIQIDAGYRMDMLVNQAIVVENKCVEKLLPIHTAQLLTYLRMADLRLGFLLNWHVPVMKNGIKRMVNQL
jgi:GxxExxY protein